MHPQSNLRIPYDILTLVIDQLGSESCDNELNALSRTCQTLLHPCRVYLFSTIAIDENGLQFAALLKKNATLSEYMQELSYIPYIIGEDIANAFLLLHNIKTLYFHGGYVCKHWTSLPPSIHHALAHLFGSRSMSRICIHNFYNLPATLLSSCLTLRHLTLSQCGILSPPCKTYDNALGAPPQLLSLDLLQYNLSGATQELPKMRRASGLPILDLSGLQSLIVSIYDNWQEKHFENILRLTPNLDYLHCSVPHGTNPNSWAQKLTPTLRSLKLTWDAYSKNDLAFPGLIKVLETLAYQPNRIKELFLILLTTVSESDVLLDLDWEALDQVLADRSGFPQLEKLTIQLCPRSRYDWEHLKAGIQARFEETKTTKFSRLFLAANDYLDFKFEAHGSYEFEFGIREDNYD